MLRVSQFSLSLLGLGLLSAREYRYYTHMVSLGLSPDNPYIIWNAVFQVCIWWGLLLFIVWHVMPGYVGKDTAR